MKKTILIVALCISMAMPVQAKTILVSQSKCTYKFVQNHKADEIYVYTYGTRVKSNGDGIIKGRCANCGYIKYSKGKRGAKITTICKLRKGAEDVDDIVVRIDYNGWNKPKTIGS